MSLHPDSFRAVLGHFVTGVTVITCTDEQGVDHGMTVSAFCSVSLHPPLVLVCIDHKASMHEVLIQAQAFAINILDASQEAIARRFADQDDQRFTGLGFVRGQLGPALLNDVLASIECQRVSQYDVGDHTIVVGETEVATMQNGTPLLYYRGGFAQLTR